MTTLPPELRQEIFRHNYIEGGSNVNRFLPINKVLLYFQLVNLYQVVALGNQRQFKLFCPSSSMDLVGPMLRQLVVYSDVSSGEDVGSDGGELNALGGLMRRMSQHDHFPNLRTLKLYSGPVAEAYFTSQPSTTSAILSRVTKLVVRGHPSLLNMVLPLFPLLANLDYVNHTSGGSSQGLTDQAWRLSAPRKMNQLRIFFNGLESDQSSILALIRATDAKTTILHGSFVDEAFSSLTLRNSDHMEELELSRSDHALDLGQFHLHPLKKIKRLLLAKSCNVRSSFYADLFDADESLIELTLGESFPIKSSDLISACIKRPAGLTRLHINVISDYFVERGSFTDKAWTECGGNTGFTRTGMREIKSVYEAVGVEVTGTAVDAMDAWDEDEYDSSHDEEESDYDHENSEVEYDE